MEAVKTIEFYSLWFDPEVGVLQDSLQIAQVAQMRNLRCALCLFFQRLRNLRLRIGKSNICCALIANVSQNAQSQNNV